MGLPGPQPALSDAVDSDARDTAASSLAVRTVFERTREPLHAPLNLYVDQTGNDAHDGLSEATAKATIDGALRALAHLDNRGTYITVSIGAGTFTAPERIDGGLAGGRYGTGARETLRFSGQGKEETIIEGHWHLSSVPLTTFYHLTLVGGLIAGDNSALWTSDVRLRGTGGRGIYVYRSSCITLAPPIELEGAFSEVLFVDYNGLLTAYEHPLTVSGPLDCSAFAVACRFGTLDLRGTIQNRELVTGSKWRLYEGGNLVHGGTSPDSYFPGTRNGNLMTCNAVVRAAGVAASVGRISAAGAVVYGKNTASCTRTGTGAYQVAFLHPAPDAAYALCPACLAPTASGASICITEQTTAGFSVATALNGASADAAFSFTAYW